jgi:type IV pilus assembly protein PilY1
MSQAKRIARAILAFAPGLLIALPAHAQLTEIYNEPLAQPASSIKPNIMLILDDSGSMAQQYTPDYLGRNGGGRNRLCFDSNDDGDGITTLLDNCEPGDPPLMTPQINTQYYNPEIRYDPAVNFDGTSRTQMNAANTSNWTAVPTDGVSPVGLDRFRRDTLDMATTSSSTAVATVNLVSNYPDRAWCKNSTDTPTDATNCRVNSAYSYPDFQFNKGLTAGTIKFRFGAPYYYQLTPTEYCTDLTLKSCTAASAPTGNFTVPGTVRYCKDSTLADCQAKFQTANGYTYPKFVGNLQSATSGSAAVAATATVTVNNQKDSSAGAITAIFVNGVNIIGGTITLNNNFGQSTAATAIANAINNFTSTPDYTATVGTRNGTTNIVTITAAQKGAATNGFTVQATFNVTSTTSATSTITLSNVDSNDAVASVQVSGVNLISSSVVCGTSCTGNNNNRAAYLATQLAAAINAGTATTGYTASAGGRNGNIVTITAPASLGSTLNDDASLAPKVGAPNVSVSVSNFTGGTTVGDVNLTTTSFSGGADDVPAGSASRINVGQFSRVNIVPFQDAANTIPSTFTKYAARTDCAGAVCTYAEEMTNFANWYAYYRSRTLMAKTAIGRAFLGIGSSYRVGFITINPSGTDLANRFLAIDDFANAAGGQKDLWYQWLYKQDSHGGTPLREALSRVGRYFGNQTNGINTGMPASPIQLACQPNIAILTTDGYWNGNGGVQLDGTAIGNQDNTDAGYSLRSEARYDGGLTGSSGTLADVAMYYYKTDLRSDLKDEVPGNAREPNAPHQHMTTFTVGLGLAGQLTYAQNYESGASPDFERLKISPKAGGLDWPSPVADSETALDDLWHAAVNGRGTFFSVRDPNELSQSITDTLNSVTARVGAGAAAATSNLQPVAGDNFAFTAQYETVTWTGDVKARTIDLDKGVVATRQLWSAAALLDQRVHTSRNIYTFDSTDTAASAGPPAQNGNRLKSFCWPGAMGATGYPTCTDGAGLSTAEMDYFLPATTSPAPSNETALPQSLTWATDGSGRDTAATKEKLVDFLRGDTANETSGGSATTDLFRDRTSLLGDIVNAQPAYVKASPFAYNTSLSVGRDPFYTEFKNTTNGINGTRKGTIFIASNDGMLHAFETDPDNNPYFQLTGIDTTVTTDDTFKGTLDTSPATGEGSERWAYIPGIVLPHLKRLADTPYTHRYYTDGSPLVGDVCFGHTDATRCASASNWHTILVAGLNDGGRGYYALDVTDPNNPKGLWELKGGDEASCLTDTEANAGTADGDCNIGLTFGNPLIVKRPSDGRWVVIVTSGYNNVNPGDGRGYLYILDAQTGLILQRLTTGLGCDGTSTTLPCVAGTADPSGLGKINAWVDDAFTNNTALAVYGGDLKGNLWRFQLDNSAAVPRNSVTLIATLTIDNSTPQPITTKPELGLVGGFRVVFVGTGKLLGLSDKTSTGRQSVYAIKDDMSGVTSPAVNMTRTGGFPTSTIDGFVRQDLSVSASDATQRVATGNAVDFTQASVHGWFIDLPDGGSAGNGAERVNVDPILQLGTLVVPSNVPSGDACAAGGFGWLNFLNFKTGSVVAGATGGMVSTKVTSSLIVGINVVQLPGGKVTTIVTTADNQQLNSDTPVAPTSVVGKHVSWRELFLE